MLLLFNHALTPKQQLDASTVLGVTEIVPLPQDLQRIWTSVPATLTALGDWIAPVKEWVMDCAQAGDYVLVEGDFGATYLMVSFSLEHGLIPICSTTERTATEERQEDGSIKVRRFRHRYFREYGV